MLYETETLQKVFNLMPKLEKAFFSNYFKENAIDKNLNKTHIRTIMMLLFEESAPMNFVSHKLGLEKGSFTPVAKKLIDIGFINKNKSEEDRRVSILSLTDEGKKYATQLRDGHHKFMLGEIEKLSLEDQVEFEAALDTILTLLDVIGSR